MTPRRVQFGAAVIAVIAVLLLTLVVIGGHDPAPTWPQVTRDGVVVQPEDLGRR